MTLVESELRAALRAEASVHLPDREAMLDRITRTTRRHHFAEGGRDAGADSCRGCLRSD